MGKQAFTAEDEGEIAVEGFMRRRWQEKQQKQGERKRGLADFSLQYEGWLYRRRL